MSKIVNSSAGVATALTVLLCAGAAQALNAHSWVSHTGVDGGACTIAAPCRTLNGAYAATAPSGEIDILDAGNYGFLTITQAIAIVNDGPGVASVAEVVISAPLTANIVLRGLTFNGIDSAPYGIEAFSFDSLVIDHCDIHGFANAGVLLVPGNASKVLVIDSVLSSDGSSVQGSIHIAPVFNASVSAQIERVQIINAGGNGIRVDSISGAAKVELRDVTVHGAAGGSGIVAVSPPSGGAPAVIHADNVAATGNAGYGLRAVGGMATVYLNRSTVTDNGIGIGASSGGAVISYSNNSFAGNGSDGSPTSTIAQK